MVVICEHCGTVASEGELICHACGAMLPVRDLNRGAAALRQGRGRPLVNESTVGSSRPVTDEYTEKLDDRDRADHAAMGQQTIVVHKPRKRTNINWAMIFAVLLTLAVLSVIGGYIFLRLTHTGQMILARMGYEADATAMWDIGAEYMDQGYIEKAIQIEEEAYAKEPEREDMYDRLQQLCEAYEAAERPADAERLYTLMYEKLDKTNPIAYQNILRLMRSQGRNMEASQFLKIAYANTGLSSFETERLEMIPASPTVSEDVGAGRYKEDKYVELISPEGNDIYYIIGDEGSLPEDGQLYEEPILLKEGGWTIRAVCVSTELVSDELNAKYVITYPSPDAPKASLAPQRYTQRQRIRLRNVGDDPNVTFYYTIDNTPPTINSPIYDEDGILLPGGKIKVRAVAVNSYGKVSNEMSVELQIDIPFKKYYRYTDDPIDGAQLMKTTKNQFVSKFGQPLKEENITDTAIRGTCSRLTYSWGEARFYISESGTLLYYIDTTSTSMRFPRSTRIGMKETEVTEQFRDLGQKNNQDGTRSLYNDSGERCYGKINILSNGQKRIDYTQVDNSYPATIVLSYYLTDGIVTRVVNSFTTN